ncbi:MAG: energy transducer TonB, partial [Wenzhouxiangella sp.]|nr:energy transducer TonB [Wenzhouxiangella sp.]
MALAETHFKARNWIEAYAWAQIWVLEHYSPEQFAGGEAEGDPGLYLLRELLSRLNDGELERAESLTEQYIRQWLPQLPEPETFCPTSEEQCRGWQPVHREPPHYPRAMLDRQYQAWVRSLVLIGPDGDVEDVQVMFASRDEFERPTRRALMRWVFSPPEDHDGESSTLMTQIID